MKQVGLLVSSTVSNININFRTAENDKNILNTLQEFQKAEKNKIVQGKKLSQCIYNENGAPYVFVKTNLNKRPIKLLIDTGAAITILASDLISQEVQRTNYIINLYGIVGKETSIKTEGIVHGLIEIEEYPLGIIMHLVNRKFSGPADGYLGYDFLSSYGVIVNINVMKLTITLNKLIKSKEEINEKEDKKEENKKEISERKENAKENVKSNENNFLNILAHVYEFPDENEKRKINAKLRRKMARVNRNMKRENYNNYLEAADFYKEEFKKINEEKVNPDLTDKNNLEHVSLHNMSNGEETEWFDAKNSDQFRAERIFNDLQLDGLSEECKETVRKVCVKFPFQFYVRDDMLRVTEVIKHKIYLIPNSKIVNVRQYRIPQLHRKIMDDIVEEFESMGIIEKCQSPYNSPAILVPKKDDLGGMSDFRFVVDYRKLNEITEIQYFPIPLINEILNELYGCKYFTTLDIKNAFHQILVDEDSRDCTAFTTGKFQYRWVRMPFGLSTAPLTWQKAINIILCELLGSGVYVYLDDVIIYAKTKEEHDRLLWRVMALLREHNLQLKISKCLFYAKEFEYLGHVISSEGMRANPRKVKAIKNYPRPSKLKHIQSFLGLCNYFRRYVKNYAKISKPLTILLKDNQPFVWTHAQQEAFDGLKQALINEVLLQFPNFDELLLNVQQR